MVPNSLRSRLALLLILANLPAAALAIGATINAQSATTEQRQQAVVQQAELIATRAGLALGIAEGVADTLAVNAEVASGGPGCSTILQAALAERPDYAGIVVSGPDAEIICAAGETTLSPSLASSLQRALASQGQLGDAVFLPEQIAPEDNFVLASRPFNGPDGRRRAIGLVIRRPAFDAIFRPQRDESIQGALALIRSNSQVVCEFNRDMIASNWLPAQALPVGLPGDPPEGMTLTAANGSNFHYAIAPVRGTMSNIVLATPLNLISTPDWARLAIALAAPLIMLLLGISAVFVGVDRLVLRWIARLRAVTASYTRGDYTPRVEGLASAPLEIADLGMSFNIMAGRIEERSHALEEALEAKNGLLRELHHRVKNNFQMIASLLALQRRELPSRLRVLLRVPEDRVLAMASAYKASYATGEIGSVSLLDLLRDIAAQLRQSFGLAAPIIQLRTEGDAVWLDLDRAVPLGLLVSEIMSSALDRPDASKRTIEIAIRRLGPQRFQVDISSEGLSDAVPTTGLAQRLVSAYRSQLGATLDTTHPDEVQISMGIDASVQVHPGRVELGP